MNSIDVQFNHEPIGLLSIEGKDEIYSLEYNDAWQEEGFALSPHLPLSQTLSSGVIKRFLENLLPEGKGLDDLTAFTHISKNNIFGLIQALGFETSGALSFGTQEENQDARFREISDKELGRRIDEIEERSITVWDKKPRLSLAGVQEKLPVLIRDDVIGLADGTLSSTHILKFQTRRHEHIVVNEYFCMRLARACKLNVASVSLKRFGSHPVLIVERFDRVVKQSSVERLHVIDGCQMLDLPPSYKYERNFGSGRDVREVREGASFTKLFETTALCQIPATAKLQILDWALFNLIIGNSDAHGKNISYFVNKAGISLAPYYDLLSIVMHEGVEHDLAMAYGNEFNINEVKGYALRTFCEETSLKPQLVSMRLKMLCTEVKRNIELEVITPSELTVPELEFITKTKKLIMQRASKLLVYSTEMSKVSF